MSDRPPGLTGPVGIPKLKTKAPRAWRNLMHAVTTTAPRNLSTVNKSLARLKRL